MTQLQSIVRAIYETNNSKQMNKTENVYDANNNNNNANDTNITKTRLQKLS